MSMCRGSLLTAALAVIPFQSSILTVMALAANPDGVLLAGIHALPGKGSFLSRDNPTHRNIPYKWVAKMPIELDVYLPSSNPAGGGGLPPALMYVHPGAWMYGNSKFFGFAELPTSSPSADPSSKVRVAAAPNLGRWSDKSDLNRHILRALDVGMAIISVNYRLTTEANKYPGANVTWPAQGQDIADAMVWIREHGGSYGVDVNRVGCWGESAGGHLCAWLAAAGGVKTIFRPNVAVDFCGPTCFLCTHNVSWLGNTPADWLFGYPPGTLQSMKEAEMNHEVVKDHDLVRQINLVRSAEPLAWVNNNTAPMFIAHGTDDSTVPVYKAELLAARLEQAGTRYILQEVDGGGHMYYQWPDKVIDDALHFSLEQFGALPEGDAGELADFDNGISLVGHNGTTSRKLQVPDASNLGFGRMGAFIPFARRVRPRKGSRNSSHLTATPDWPIGHQVV